MDKYTDEELKDLWDQLSDVPFDEDDKGFLYLAKPWHIFPEGTEREDIWHWFDDNHSKGVYALMGLKKED